LNDESGDDRFLKSVETMPKTLSSRLIVAGFTLTVLGIISRVCFRWPLVEEKFAHGDGWSSWEPSRCIDWSPLSFGLFILGSLLTLCGVTLWSRRGALSQIAGLGLVSISLPWFALASPVLRCVAVIPLFAAILSGFVLLSIGLFRFVWMRWLGRLQASS
jgi:hypothetical protein